MKRPKPADLIKSARESCGLTQEQAAARVGYSVSALCKFEQGRATPPKRGLAHILATLKP